MKKQISMLFAVLAGGALASVAYAETGNVAPGQTQDVGSSANGATATPPALPCVVLSSTVRIGTSANVHGAFDCRAATATTPAVIGVGACHTAGLIKSRTYTCVEVKDAAGVVTGYSPVGCTSTAPLIKEGAAAYFAATTGGSVAATPIGAACDAGGVLGIVTSSTTKALGQ